MAQHARYNRIPILALTARSTKEDQEKCLDAGMDRCLSKPIQIEELFGAVESLVTTIRQAIAAPASEKQSVKTILDRSEVLGRVEGDIDLLHEIINLFHDECARLMDRIGEAIDLKDAEALERAAHSLKGSLGNFGAARAVGKALALEKIGHSGELSTAVEKLKELKEELSLLNPELESLRQETSA